MKAISMRTKPRKGPKKALLLSLGGIVRFLPGHRFGRLASMESVLCWGYRAQGLDGLNRLVNFLREPRLGHGVVPGVREVRAGAPADSRYLVHARRAEDLEDHGLVRPEFRCVVPHDIGVEPELALHPAFHEAAGERPDALGDLLLEGLLGEFEEHPMFGFLPGRSHIPAHPVGGKQTFGFPATSPSFPPSCGRR